MAQNPNLLDPEAIKLTAKAGGRQVEEELYSRPAWNNGKFGPLTARFPFSYSVISLLNNENSSSTAAQRLQEISDEAQSQQERFDAAQI